jgi:hypothetical protein
MTAHWLVIKTGSFPFLTKYPELTLDKWAKQFGDLYSLWLGTQLFVIISSPEIAKDLMVTNGSVFSSRKEMFLKSQTIFAGRGITATPYNDRWWVLLPLYFTLSILTNSCWLVKEETPSNCSDLASYEGCRRVHSHPGYGGNGHD